MHGHVNVKSVVLYSSFQFGKYQKHKTVNISEHFWLGQRTVSSIPAILRVYKVYGAWKTDIQGFWPVSADRTN